MKEEMNPHTCKPNTSSMALTIRNESHVISNNKPKIRIVHIFAPEIIKTDVANFRKLVQRLTGKPDGRKGDKKAMSGANMALESECCKAKETTISCNGYWNSGSSDRVKEEEEENSSFFGGLGDLDGFIQGFSDFPLLPLNDVLAESRDASFLA